MHYPYNVSFYDNDTWIAFGLNVNPVTGYGSEFEITHSNKGKLMACTGLKDRNGDLIWEGDVLRTPAKDNWEKINYVSYEVFFHDNDSCDRHIGWQMNRTHFYGSICGTRIFPNFTPKSVAAMEVIGNIYENPDSLT